MESSELFALGVLAICLMEIATKAGVRMQSWWNKRAGRQKPTPPMHSGRDDWYVFFHCADLVGPDSLWNTRRQQASQHAETAKNQARIVDRRPRLNA